MLDCARSRISSARPAGLNLLILAAMDLAGPSAERSPRPDAAGIGLGGLCPGAAFRRSAPRSRSADRLGDAAVFRAHVRSSHGTAIGKVIAGMLPMKQNAAR